MVQVAGIVFALRKAALAHNSHVSRNSHVLDALTVRVRPVSHNR